VKQTIAGNNLNPKALLDELNITEEQLEDDIDEDNN
jgi:hypothetical protein